MDARTILHECEATVCVVRYRAGIGELEGALRWYNHSGPPANPAVLHQVCLKAGKVSGGEALVRLGDTPGDELMGWQWIDALEVVEVLGGLAEDGKTVVPISKPIIPLSGEVTLLASNG